MRKGAFLLFTVLAACAGKTTPSEPATTSSTPSALTDADLAKRWEHVTVLDQQQRIFRGANGFYAFTSRQTGSGGKGATYAFDAIYQSADGATWHRAAMLNDGTVAFAQVHDVAYGDGHFVAAGLANGSQGGIATSADGASWSPFGLRATGVGAVAFANDRFVAGGAPNDFQVSTDGTTWTTVARPLMQMNSAAYGNGSYVVFGACGMMSSPDGRSWTDTTPSCGMSGAPCVAPPGGGVADQSACAYLTPGFFGAGKFWVMNLSSPDGKTWTALGGQLPTAALGDYLFDATNTSKLLAWKDGEAPATVAGDDIRSAEAASGTEPETVTVAFPNGATCLTNTCVILGKDLYLLE